MGVITVLTDFGHTDSYVGVMKGVIAGISPHVQVVDLTHNIQPQAILAARFNLLVSYGFFPAGTVHLVVVDPGVGTRRGAIATHINTPSGQQTIVAPDNGILTGFDVTAVVALTNTSYWRTPQPSRTFHGRDIFAPVAAHLANGVPLADLGPPRSPSSLVRLPISDAVATEQGYRGSIQYRDHFGNLVTNIPASSIPADIDTTLESPWQVQLGRHTLPSSLSYGHTAPGDGLALIGNHGYVEIAVNGGSAAEVFATKVGDRVELIYARRG